MTLKLAFDRSVRKVDVDGRLHVEISNISKANVCPYLGSEIPNASALGLVPDKVYMLLRDPAELEKAAPTFNNLPLLSKHVPVSAEDHQPDLIVGSTGTDAVFDGTYLKNSLVVWEAIAIAGIESKEQCELSSAYRYTPDMRPGIYEGTPYDGVMRNIQGNHVALVEVGRAGPDVVVGDTNPFITTMEYQNMKASRKAIAVKAALGTYLRPMIAQDQAIVDLGALVRGVKAATFAQDKARIVKDVSAKIKDVDQAALAEVIQFAADAEPDDEKDDKKNPAADSDEQGEEESDEDYKKRMDAKKQAADDAEKDNDDKKKAAMDAAIKLAVANAEKATIEKMNAIRAAEKEVQPFIGEVVAQDSAEAVYKLALDHAKIDLTGVPSAAYRAMVGMLSKEVKQPRVAMDAASADDFAKRFPTAGKLVRS